MKTSLLDPIFTVDGELQSLPEILHRLSASSTSSSKAIGSFDYLRRHQKRAWHLFLVQTAAMIGPCKSAEEWEEALTAHGLEMWHLETELGKPAFMQPPVDSVDGWKLIPTPDEADVLSTTAGHTVKDEAILKPRSEHWIYALVTTQTTGWYAGGGGAWQAGVRMNSGYSDRPYVSLVSDLDWGSRFRSDVSIAQEAPERGDIQFLWSLPYEEPVTLQDCHTLFVEVCRRFRCHEGEFYRKGAKRRIPSAEDLDGVVGDPWVPIDVAKEKAMSTPSAGFVYTRVQELLAGENYKTPSLQVSSERPLYLVAESLGTNQTKTDGFHERTVFIPANVMTKWLNKQDRDIFAERSRARIITAADVKKSALRPALKVLKEIDFSNSEGYKKLHQWESSYESAVDRVFFEHLWDSVDQDQKTAQEEWKSRVTHLAERELQRAEDTISDTRKWKLRPKARALFYSKLKQL